MLVLRLRHFLVGLVLCTRAQAGAGEDLPPAVTSIKGWVCATPEDGETVRVDLVSPGAFPVSRETRPDGKGAFRFDQLVPGAYRVRAMIEGKDSLGKRRERQFGGTIVIELKGEQVISIGCPMKAKRAKERDAP